jgi:hypothetical protein
MSSVVLRGVVVYGLVRIMKRIFANEFKVGDWVVTPRIFSGLSQDGKLHGVFKLSKIEEIAVKDFMKICYVKCWTVIGDKWIYKTASPVDTSILYLLDKEEAGVFQKRLILKGLEDDEK